MLIKQIDCIDLETFERALCDLFDVLWPAIESAPFASIAGIGFPPEFGRDDNLSAKWRESFADEFLVVQRAIHLGGVEERHTSLDCGVKKRCHLLLVFGWPIGPTHSHAAESDGRYFQVALSKFPFLHCCSFRRPCAGHLRSCCGSEEN